MPRKCSVCALVNVAELNAELIAGKAPKSGIARRFGVSDDALDRHAENANGKHIPIALLDAKNATDVALAEDVLAQVRQMIPRVLGCLDAAEKDKDRKSVTAFMKEFRGFAELVLRAEGKLQTGGVNVTVGVGMGSPAAAGAPEPELSIDQLAEVLASLPPEDLRQALEQAQQIHADNQEADRIAREALRPAPALAPVPGNLSAQTRPSPSPRGESLFQPGRMPGT